MGMHSKKSHVTFPVPRDFLIFPISYKIDNDFDMKEKLNGSI